MINWQNGTTPINETNMNKLVQEDMITDAYSSSNTYAVGDYCIYENTLYKCTTAIATAENWNSAHWTAVTVTDEIKENAVAISSTQPTTEEKVWIKKGKNLLNKNKLERAAIIANSTSSSLDLNPLACTTEWIECLPSKSYTLSNGNRARWQFKNSSGVITYAGGNTVTTASDTKYLRCYCYYDENSAGIDNVNLQIEQNAIATSYEAYIPKKILTKNCNNVFEEFYNEENVNQESYSLGEKKIGTWIDGKPLYRKVVNFGELPNNTVKEISHNISNIDKIIRLSGYAYRPADGFFIPIPQGAYNNTACSIFSSSTKITITTYTNRSLFTECYIVIEYTKTTD